MPIYVFKCEACGTVGELLLSMKQKLPETVECSECGGPALRSYQAELSKVKAFQPYTEENFDGKSVEVTSVKARDALCEEHGVTYDSVSKSRSHKVQEPFTLDDKLIEDVLEETQGGKILPDDVREACEEAPIDD